MTTNGWKAVMTELKRLVGADTPAELLEAVKALQQQERQQRERADATGAVLVMFRLTEPVEVVSALPTVNCTASLEAIDGTRQVFAWLADSFLERQRSALERAQQQQAVQAAREDLIAQLRAAGVDVDGALKAAAAEGQGEGGQET